MLFRKRKGSAMKAILAAVAVLAVGCGTQRENHGEPIVPEGMSFEDIHGAGMSLLIAGAPRYSCTNLYSPTNRQGSTSITPEDFERLAALFTEEKMVEYRADTAKAGAARGADVIWAGFSPQNRPNPGGGFKFLRNAGNSKATEELIETFVHFGQYSCATR